MQAFYALTDGATVHAGLPTELRIPTLAELQSTNALLYPPGDVIWEELEDDISQHWLAIGLAPEMSQYVSLDLAPERLGRCMDSFIDTHASPGDCAVIANSFADWLAQLLASPQPWFWLRDDIPLIPGRVDAMHHIYSCSFSAAALGQREAA